MRGAITTSRYKQRIAVLDGFACAEELQQLSAYQLDAVVHS